MEDVRADSDREIVDGRFRVEARLGSGGMGTVWRVQHVVSLQRFALKTLDPSYAAQPEATRRFVREARAAAALRTRHVVRIVDAQMQYLHKAQPLPFLVMELLEGRTLLEVLDTGGRLELGELGWLSGQLGRALEAAHRQGIVHRDLKPSNVFIAEDDEGEPMIKLCDFGIAKLIDPAGEGSLETHTGALLGTPMYLAPELLRGAADAVPATDQWALGLLAYRALAGAEYFGRMRGLPSLVLAIANDPMVAPSALAPALPTAFDDWFLRSCARDPAARFLDVSAQVAALAAALGKPAPLPIAPRLATAAAHLPRQPERLADPAARSAPLAANPPAPKLRQARPTAPARRRARRLVLVTTVAWAVGALFAATWIEGRLRTMEVHAATTSAPPVVLPALPAHLAPVAPSVPVMERAPLATPPAPSRGTPLAVGREARASPSRPGDRPRSASPPPGGAHQGNDAGTRGVARPGRVARTCSCRAGGAGQGQGGLVPALGRVRERALRGRDLLCETTPRPRRCGDCDRGAAGGPGRAAADADDAYGAALTRAIAAKERALDVNEPPRWEEALRLFQETAALRATREAAYEIGFAAERLSRTDLAVESYEAAITLGLSGPPSVAGAFVAAHAPALARLEVRGPAGTRLSVAGVERGRLPLPRPLVLFPGEIELEVVDTGGHTATVTAHLEAGRSDVLDLRWAADGGVAADIGAECAGDTGGARASQDLRRGVAAHHRRRCGRRGGGRASKTQLNQ